MVDKSLTGETETAGSIALNEITKDMGALHDVLTNIERQSNTMTIHEFLPFVPLFQINSKISDDERKTLSSKYLRAVSLYKPVVLIQSRANPVPLLRLPQLFTATRTPTDDRAAELMAFNQAMQKSDAPRYRHEGEAAYTSHFENAQNSEDVINAIAVAKNETMDILVSFARLYGLDIPEDASEAEDAIAKTEVWDFADED